MEFDRMAEYTILAQARKHISGIRDYTVENWGGDQAKNYLAEMNVVFDFLAQNPDVGANRSDDLKPGIMSFVYRSHVIYYRKSRANIVIVAVLHQSMVPQKHLFEVGP
ncbi:type II toxin-antitoxin system RelE/ParE family toxin [Synergistaceae bacterium OttesenSCG-928-I11]|nr:type II toxin-antitoxin system RelE/ParE family toxin [Synergistaceae bacterium OttesenSCG-928-I11]